MLAMVSKIRFAALVGLVAFSVTACGGDDEPKAAAADKPTEAEETPSEATGEISDDCKLAVLNWETIASKQHADLVFGFADHAADPTISQHANEIETFCPKELNAQVAKINYELAVAEAQLAAGNESTTEAERAALKDEIGAVSAAVR